MHLAKLRSQTLKCPQRQNNIRFGYDLQMVRFQSRMIMKENSWDFQIQFQTTPEMSIDDTTIVWNEEGSPFITVGRLTVKHQKVNSAKDNDFGENLSFSPGNGLAVHRPVGAINRLRSIVYPIVANDRHQKRGVKYQEPTV